MNSYQAQSCRLCLEAGASFINIFEKFQDSTIASVLAKNFWFQINENDGMPEWVCEACWIQTKTFHQFYKRLMLRHKSYLNSVLLDDIKRERSVSPGDEALETDLFVVKFEDEMDITIKADDTQTVSVKEGSRDEDDNANSWDQSEADPTTDEDQPAVDKPRSLSKKETENSEIRKYVSMKCEICADVGFHTLLEAGKHYREVHQTKGYLTCCGRKFRRRVVLLEHINKYHINPDANRLSKKEAGNAEIRKYFSMKCEICSDVGFDTLLEAGKHYREVHQTKGYLTCCGRKISTRQLLLQHIQYHINPDAAYRCDQCGICCTSKNSLRIHKKSHLPAAHQCSLCPKAFPFASNLRYHVRDKHTSSVKFPCDQCSKSCANNHLLTSHKKHVHEGRRQHVCEVCGRVYKNKGDLQNHIEGTHSTTPLPKFQCDMCGAWSKNKRTLLAHLKWHQSKANVVNCKICKKKVKERYLAGHIRETHAERKHQCTICDKSFRSPLNLKEHMALHTGIDLYSCTYCDRTFKSNANMYAHRKKAHSEDWARDKVEKNERPQQILVDE